MHSKELTPTHKTKADVDMSPRAVAGRLEEVRQLYRLGISLMAIRIDEAVAVEPKR